MTSDWIISEGGPLIVIDEALKKNWGGIFKLTLPDPSARSDYDRACSLTSQLEKIDVVGGSSLIIGDIPMNTCFWSSDPDNLCIVQICYSTPSFDVGKTMRNFSKKKGRLASEQSIVFNFYGRKISLFDSSDGGDREPRAVNAPLNVGAYAIRTYVYQHDEETSLVIHSFEPQNR